MPVLPEEQAPIKQPKALAPRDHDGSELTDIVDENDVCQVSIDPDDSEAVAKLEQMRGQTETTESDELSLFTVQDLAQMLAEVEYDCYIGKLLRSQNSRRQSRSKAFAPLFNDGRSSVPITEPFQTEFQQNLRTSMRLPLEREDSERRNQSPPKRGSVPDHPR
jgi:hypothetical protein